jgi:hypothetical protein
MATEAQVQANRLNAQKSAGPRTPEGKAVSAQNSLKHGLFAREGVIRGEDWEEYEMHREMLLEQLAPAGPLEVILATRVVDLSWRLQRAAQDRNEAFGALYDRYIARQAAGPEADAGGDTGLGGAGVPPSHGEPQALTAHGQSLPPTRSGDAQDTITPAERGKLLGRMILADFEQEAVLERLQRYERRIESSFYRTLNELRRVHDQRCKAQQELAGTLDRWRQEDGEARKARALACDWRGASSPSPPGAATNTPGAHDCGLRISDCGLENAGLERQTSALVPHDSTPPSFPYSHGTPAPADELCKTNPISKCEVPSLKLQGSDQKEHVPSAATSNSTLPRKRLTASLQTCETNPIPEGVSSWKCEVSSESCKTNPISPTGTRPAGVTCEVSTVTSERSGSPCSDFKLQTSNFTLPHGQSCKTNPISPDPLSGARGVRPADRQ